MGTGHSILQTLKATPASVVYSVKSHTLAALDHKLLLLGASFHLLLLPGIQSDLDRQLMEEQWEMLCQMMQEKATFVFGKQGCLTDTDLHTALKVRGYILQWSLDSTVCLYTAENLKICPVPFC